MIRYIPIPVPEGEDGPLSFLFVDTVTDRVIEIDGQQIFDSPADVAQAVRRTHADELLLRRLTSLVPPLTRRWPS